MAIQVADNFHYQGSKPLDARAKYDTVALMKAATESTLYDGLLAYVEENKTYYTFDSRNTVESATGKWRVYESGGGGGASDLADLNDVTISTPSDGDVLQYDNETGEWVNSAAPSADVAVDDLTDVTLNNLSSGQILKYNATSQKWENSNESGGGDLSDLGDVAITTPSNGQVLKYNSTSQKWENTSDEGEVVYGYAATLTIDNPIDFITAVNAMTPHSAITYSNQSIFNNKSGSHFMIYAGSVRAYLLYSEYPFEIKCQPVYQSSRNWVSLSRRTSDGVQHAGFTSQDAFTYSTGITSIDNATIPAAWTFDRNLFNDDETGVFFLSSTIDKSTSSSYYNGKFYCVDGVKFYSDASHTTLITPEADKVYVDRVTNKQYAWNGFTYVEQGASVSELSDLDDVNLTSPTDGQVLTYDATNQVWKNANGGSATVAHLSDITDVDITSITDGQMIAWDATNSKWVNVNAPSGGGGHTIEDSSGTDLTQRDTMQFGDSFSPTDDSTNQKTVVNLNKMTSGDIDDVCYPRPSGGGGGAVYKQTLAAGATSVSFTGLTLDEDTRVRIYSNPFVLGLVTNVSQTSTSLTLTCNAQSSAVKIMIEVVGGGEDISLPDLNNVSFNSAYDELFQYVNNNKLIYGTSVFNAALTSWTDAYYDDQGDITRIASLQCTSNPNMTRMPNYSNPTVPSNVYGNVSISGFSNGIYTYKFAKDGYVVYASVNTDKNTVAQFIAEGNIFIRKKVSAGDTLDMPSYGSKPETGFMSYFYLDN